MEAKLPARKKYGGGSGLVAGPGFKSGREAVKVVSGVFDSHTSPPNTAAEAMQHEYQHELQHELQHEYQHEYQHE